MEYNAYSNSVQPPDPVPIQAAGITAKATLDAARMSSQATLAAAALGAAVVLVAAILQVSSGRLHELLFPKSRTAESDQPEARPPASKSAEIPAVKLPESKPQSEVPSGSIYTVRVSGVLNLREGPVAIGSPKLLLQNGQSVIVDETREGWFVENWEGIEPCAWVRVVVTGSSDEDSVTGWCSANYLQASGRDPIAIPLASFNETKDRRDTERLAAETELQALRQREIQRAAAESRIRAREQGDLPQRRGPEVIESMHRAGRFESWSYRSGSGYYWTNWHSYSLRVRY